MVVVRVFHKILQIYISAYFVCNVQIFQIRRLRNIIPISVSCTTSLFVVCCCFFIYRFANFYFTAHANALFASRWWFVQSLHLVPVFVVPRFYLRYYAFFNFV